MTDNEKTWRKLGDIVDGIMQLQAEVRASGGKLVRDPDDREVYDILERIERKILAKGVKRAPPRSADSD